MPRPRLQRQISLNPEIRYFKPLGVPMKDLIKTELSPEELEAFYLRFLKKLDQKEAALKMNTSTSTYQRILYQAAHKIATALAYGQAIEINN